MSLLINISNYFQTNTRIIQIVKSKYQTTIYQMSLKLEIKKKMQDRSPRVKALDFHPDQTWVVFGLYSGTLALHDYSTNTCIRTIEASIYPIRAIRFVPKKQWIVCGSDDFHIRVFNYNTMEKVKQFQAHNDFLRAIIVHPTDPYIVSCSDQGKVKVWNYQKDFSQVSVLQQHKHFVMALAFNPKDLAKFASGSMDKTIKIWDIRSQGKANLTLTGHKAGVNCLDFHHTDKPHLVSGSDDRTIKVWDYQTKQCLKTIQSYTLAVSGVCFHPQLPILISTGQQGKTLIHHTSSYTALNALQHNLGMGWACAVSSQNTNIISVGYDEGSVVFRIGSDQPVVSLSNGKTIWSKSMQIYIANLKAVDLEANKSGQSVDVNGKQLGHVQIYPSYIKHSKNGHHFGICNQSQFSVIKTASFKSVLLGNGTSLIWNGDSDFAVLQNDTINLYSNFEYSSSLKLPFVANKIYEGYFMSVAGPENLYLYDWEYVQKPVHILDLKVNKLWWNDSGNLLAVSASEKLLVYRLDKKTKALIEILSLSSKVTSGVFLGDLFFYLNHNAKLNIILKGKNFFIQNYEKKKYILGILEPQNRMYFFDRNNHFYSLEINFKFFKDIQKFIQSKGQQDIPQILQNHDIAAKILHQFSFTKQAYKIVKNQDMKFEMASKLGLTRQALKIAQSTHSAHKINQIGDLALKKGDIELAIECFESSTDLNSLLLIFSSLSLPKKLQELAIKAEKMTKMNIAYSCYYLTNQPNKCVDVLIKAKKFIQASLFSRTYCPNRVQQCVKLWKTSLSDENIANKISDLTQDDDDEEEDQQDEQVQAQA